MRLRGTGSIFRKQGTRFWQISYYDSNGVQVQESSKSEKKSVAEALLRDRLAKADAGLPVESAKKLRYEDMRKSLLADMANKGNRGLKKYKHGLPGGCSTSTSSSRVRLPARSPPTSSTSLSVTSKTTAMRTA